jgi:hypothetical protein
MGRRKDSSDSEEYSSATSISSDESSASSSESELSSEDDGQGFYSRKGHAAKRAKTRAGTTPKSNPNQYELPPHPLPHTPCCPASFRNFLGVSSNVGDAQVLNGRLHALRSGGHASVRDARTQPVHRLWLRRERVGGGRNVRSTRRHRRTIRQREVRTIKALHVARSHAVLPTALKPGGTEFQPMRQRRVLAVRRGGHGALRGTRSRAALHAHALHAQRSARRDGLRRAHRAAPVRGHRLPEDRQRAYNALSPSRVVSTWSLGRCHRQSTDS